MLDEATKQTEMVLSHHLQNFGVNWDEFMRGYAEDAVMITPQGQLNGVAAIRTFFEALPPNLLPLIKIHRQEFKDDYGYIYWTAEPALRMGSDAFVVRDGKIVAQLVSFYPLTFE